MNIVVIQFIKYVTDSKNCPLFFVLYLVFIPTTRKTTRYEYGKIFLKQLSMQDSEYFQRTHVLNL